MDDIIATLARFFTQAPWYYLSWPAVAMVAGTLIGLSKSAVDQLAVVPRTGRGLVGLVTRVAARKARVKVPPDWLMNLRECPEVWSNEQIRELVTNTKGGPWLVRAWNSRQQRVRPIKQHEN